MNPEKIVSLAVSTALAAGLMTGCSGTASRESASSAVESASSPAASASAPADSPAASYPDSALEAPAEEKEHVSVYAAPSLPASSAVQGAPVPTAPDAKE